MVVLCHGDCLLMFSWTDFPVMCPLRDLLSFVTRVQHEHVPTCFVPSPTNQECDGACLKDGDRGASDDTDLAAMRHVSGVASVENLRSRYAKVRLEHMYTLCRVQYS